MNGPRLADPHRVSERPGILMIRYPEAVESIRRVIHRKPMLEPDQDHAYWLSRPAEERIEALTQLRRDYEGWTDETEPRLPRIARVLRKA